MEAAAASTIARAAAPLRRLLQRRAQLPRPADAVEIIGGGARVPSVQAALSAVAEEFGVAAGSSGDALGRHLNMVGGGFGDPTSAPPQLLRSPASDGYSRVNGFSILGFLGFRVCGFVCPKGCVTNRVTGFWFWFSFGFKSSACIFRRYSKGWLDVFHGFKSRESSVHTYFAEEAVAMGAAAVALNASYARAGKANTRGGKGRGDILYPIHNRAHAQLFAFASSKKSSVQSSSSPTVTTLQG